MSFADILSSVAMALTTLPMPRDPELSDYGYGGKKFGNVQTCTAQGFFFMFGSYVMFAYNLGLCVYNTGTIAFRMQERTIVKYVEPFIHLFSMAVGLAVSVPALSFNSYQPLKNRVWCAFDTNAQDNNFYHIFVPTMKMMFLAVTLISGLLMVGRVYYIERNLSHFRNSPDYEIAARYMKNTKVLIVQVSLYVSSYAVTLLFPVLINTLPADVDRATLFHFAEVLFPLQGFFNLLIFVSHKIYNYRRVHNDASRCYALKLLFAGDNEEIMLFSRVSMINVGRNRRLIELELSDEGGVVQHLSIEENIPPSFADVFYDDDDECAQNLSGFSPLKSPVAPSIDAPTGGSASSHENERSNISKGNSSRMSWISWMSRSSNNADISRGGLSGFSSVNEEKG